MLLLTALLSSCARVEDAAFEAGVAAPTLIIWGEHDRVLPVSAADVFGARIPDSRLVVFEATGYSPMTEAPRRSAETISAFLAETDPAAADRGE